MSKEPPTTPSGESSRVHLEAHDFEQRAEQFWATMTKDEQLLAFYAIMRRVHQAEIIERGTYRYVLYDAFGFDPRSYVLGMDCGFMDIHNRLADSEGSEDDDASL